MTAPFDQPFYDRLMDEPDVRDHATHTDGWMRGYAYCAIVAARIAAEQVAVPQIPDLAIGDHVLVSVRGIIMDTKTNRDKTYLVDIGIGRHVWVARSALNAAAMAAKESDHE